MNHNLQLNDAAAETVLNAINRIAGAVVAARALPGISDEMRCYLGTIFDAGYVIDAIVFDTNAQTDSEYAVDACAPAGIERPMPRCPVCDVDTTLPLGCVRCEPSAEDVALRDVLDEEDVAMAEMRDKRDRLLARLDRGIITMREFQMALDPAGISQAHPCIEPGCDHTVAFDDEPYCFEHSPDEGSSVRGYSYLVYALRASQTADTVDNFIM